MLFSIEFHRTGIGFDSVAANPSTAAIALIFNRNDLLDAIYGTMNE
jgi:hypothetical protein